MQIAAKKTNTRLSRWKPLPLLVGGLALSGCSGNQPDGCYVVENDGGPQACYCVISGVAAEGTFTGNGCTPAQAAPDCSPCSDATVSGLLNPDSPSDSTLTAGGMTVRLDLTGQSGQSLVATIDVLNCGQLVGSSSIPSGGSKTFNSGGTSVTVNVGDISNGSPRSAQVEAVVVCGK